MNKIIKLSMEPGDNLVMLLKQGSTVHVTGLCIPDLDNSAASSFEFDENEELANVIEILEEQVSLHRNPDENWKQLTRRVALGHLRLLYVVSQNTEAAPAEGE